MNSGVYQILNTENGKRYIGSSKNLMTRRYTHWRHLGKGQHSNPHLQSSYNEYGSGAFQFSVLEECELEFLLGREDYWIGYYQTRNPDNGYNLRGAERVEFSEQTKARMSANTSARRPDVRKRMAEAQKGNQNHLGKPHTEETKAKISENRKGKCVGEENPAKRPEVKEKFLGENNHFFGKSHTEDTKKKLSDSRTGKPWSESRKLAETEEVKAKRAAKSSTTQKGKPWSEARRAAQIERGKSNSPCSSNF